MHVLVTTDTVGGVWTYTRELVSGLARRGVRVTLVSFGSIPEPRQMTWMEGLRNIEFLPTAFKLEWMQESADDVRASLDCLSSVVQEKRPDLLHLNQFCYGALEVDVPKIVVAHSDVLSWWAVVHGDPPPDAGWIRWYRQTVQRGLDGATMVVSPSRWMLHQLEKYYGPRQHSTVIYNGRSPQLFNPHGEKEEFVLSVGRLWDAAKQTSLLTEADCGLRVVIAGSTEHPDETYRRDVGLSFGAGLFEKRGSQTPEQLRVLYSSAAIYAATSRYEPFGLAPLEAALSRCAIVANDLPSFHEIWGGTATYFRTNNAESLRETLRQLHENRDLRRHHAELSYLRARRMFTADRMVDETMTLFQDLVSVRTLAA
jgi:glycosyltransferase involved in cell wall biosynthesis